MTNARLGAVLAAAGFLLIATATHAADGGTPAEAKQMLSKAVARYKAAGKEALTDFNAGKAPFRDRDLYVVCISADHKIAANGAYPMYVGASADDQTDAKGNPVGRALWDAATKNANGSLDYPMLNPVSGKLATKTMFYSKVAPDMLCGVGVYSAAKP
jgi:hypothetical protein